MIAASCRNWDAVAHYDDPFAWARRVLINRATSRWHKLSRERKVVERLAVRFDETERFAGDADPR